MRVYYAHAMVLYGTDIEKTEVEIIRAGLPGYDLVDPGEHDGNLEKSEQGMRYCFNLIDGCDALAFSKLLGKVTSGVGLEVNFALSKNKAVYFIDGNKLSRIAKRISYLTRERTWKHYDFWRSVTGRDEAQSLSES